MTIRQQYANEELVRKLRSMLDDLPALRTRAIKKLEHWREAAIKRLLARQQELEKALIEKFERLEFDTQLFVEKNERRKTQQQRRWQSEPFAYLNKSEIERISNSLRSIREELEQSKLILSGNNGQSLGDDPILGKLSGTMRFGETTSTRSTVNRSYETTASSDHDLGLELKRVLEICTSPPCSTTTQSTDEINSKSPLQSLDHLEYSYEVKPKSPPNKINTSTTDNRRHARLITNVPHEQSEDDQSEVSIVSNSPSINETTTDDKTRRSQRLREVRKTLRNKYDDNNNPNIPSSPKPNQDQAEPVHIPVEHITHTLKETTNVVPPFYQRSSVPTSMDSRDRRYRSRTLEVNQNRSVDNHIYGNAASKSKESSIHRSETHRHRNNNRLSYRRSSEDSQDKQSLIRRHNDSIYNDNNEIWFDVAAEHWIELLERGWRPTAGLPGVALISFADEDEDTIRKRRNRDIVETNSLDLHEKISRDEYLALFNNLDFAYTRTIDLGNEFWRFLAINEHQYLCLYHQLNKQFILYKPDQSLLSFPWPYDGIVDISWSNATKTWVIATQTQIVICNRSFSKVLQAIDIKGDWPKRITSCSSSVFHTYKLSASSSLRLPSSRSSDRKERPQFLLERFDYKLNSICKHILESSTIWDIEADDITDHLAVLCDVALIIFDYQLNILMRIEVTGFKVTRDYFGGWLVADYYNSCVWQIRRNEYLKANQILQVERPWSVFLDRNTWTLITLSETQNRAKRLLFFSMKSIPSCLETTNLSSAPSQQSTSPTSSVSESLL